MIKTKNSYDLDYFKSVYQTYVGENHQDSYLIKLSSFYMYNYFLVNGIDLKEKKILDFGCGLGHITKSINADCFDISSYCQEKLIKEGRKVFKGEEQISENYYDIILCNHSFEHYLYPTSALENFKKYLKKDGILCLVLPIDKIQDKTIKHQDVHKHFYSWNFQNISNLLIEYSFEIIHQELVYGPTGLKKLNDLDLIRKLGKWRRIFKSQLTLAKNT
ncbi:hypothetical protein A5893_14365 [Pedobacter psychrophilus]|uniref:Methyltransferase type 11 domain-containing protein n=1 Tax=Pedobacter psychrophilus TaxID=1826909 RepID=A0A179DCF0_9SPHI|nr:class I SAM-dependent methyltransferase [Pedobacter psychrophilus]OAQ38594.1 hypothetical protein A5893_14365 [Pedobacter psychrophilus]